MIDLHTHILPGLDDGAATLADSLEMARAAVADGVTIAAATPHVRDDFPTSAAAMERQVALVRDALERAGIPLAVRPGGEIALDQLDQLEPAELARFGLAGNAVVVLLEFPYWGWPLALEARIAELHGRGITAVLAHPERNGEVQGQPELLRAVVEAGALVQLTAASLDGRTGRRARVTAFDLLDRGLAHLVASDAHTPDVRGIGMGSAAAEIGDEALAHWLTHEVPSAIVAGSLIPARPRLRRRRGLFGR